MTTAPVAIVTGGSRGIGAAIARLLAAHGYAVAVNYHTSAKAAQDVVDSILEKGGKAVAIQADMGREEDVCRLFAETDEKLGPVTALVNNAALNRTHGSGAIEDMPWQLIDDIFRTNVYGVFIACREAIRRMKENGGGAIVNLSSEAARFGGNRMAHYAASKAAVATMTVALAREVAAYHIRANAVSPGVIETEAQNAASPERLAGLKASIPMGRMGSPEEVAEVVLWLLSDKASYVSGACLPINGAR